MPICKMNGQINPNTSSQEPYEDSVSQEQVSDGQELYENSDMSSAEGNENNDFESHSDQSSEVVSSEDERESKAEHECPWSPIQDEAIACLDNELQELIITKRGRPHWRR